MNWENLSHSILPKGSSGKIQRLKIKFNEEDIRKFLFSTRFLFQNLDRVILFDDQYKLVGDTDTLDLDPRSFSQKLNIIELEILDDESSKKIVNKKSAISSLKAGDEKIEIKKIKKQPTEPKIYNIKDYIVYPKHGVGKIISVEKAKIGEIEINFYKVFIEKEKLTLSIPLNQQSHLRHVSSINQINKAISILKSKPKIKRTMWSRRAQEYEQKINSGKLYDLAEVVRDLNKKTDVIAEQSYSERQLFEKAYDRLKSELEVVLGEKGQPKMDKALKREEILKEKENLV